MFSNEVKKKQIQHLQEKHGYDVTNVFQVPEVKEKIKRKMLSDYGVDNIAKSDECKAKHKLHEKETIAKRNATKKRNHTFNTSKSEEKAYAMLVDFFGKENVKRQHSSSIYPFNCDFYIEMYDLYIEFNGSWTHGKHPYDETSEEDKNIVEKWKGKHTKYYDVAIHTWTIRDVDKRNIVKQNNVNIREFWKIEELKEFLKDFDK